MKTRPTYTIKPVAMACALALGAPSLAQAAGYKIPEQSVNGTALSAAYVANASGADAAYYNPAAMVFNADGATIAGDLTYIHLPGIHYSGALGTDISRKENFLAPHLQYVSPAVGKARFGLAVGSPAGLSKRWRGPGRAFAEEFTLQTIELNPTAGYQINDQLGVAAGFRAIYSSGVVKSWGTGGVLFRDLTGDSIDYGYNLALHFKPTDAMDLAVTYRSEVTLTVDGNAKLGHTALGTQYDGGASVEVPVPAALTLAAAFDVTPDTTLEVLVERTYWSAYDKLDFEYASAFVGPVAAGMTAAFDNPSLKNWKDVNTYRIGLTHQWDDKLTLMAAFAIDETPAPDATIGFELPDSDGKIYSLGARYKQSDELTLGVGVLYSDKETVNLPTSTYSNGSAYLLSIGGEYRM